MGETHNREMQPENTKRLENVGKAIEMKKNTQLNLRVSLKHGITLNQEMLPDGNIHPY